MKLPFLILLLITTWFTNNVISHSPESRLLDRSDFPDDFIFGTATSAFQLMMICGCFFWVGNDGI
ncbi:hypothetical protein F2Q70_00024599 [Brassica cretica]|uniref:Thioglucosidase n=2 Tax=Brassica cretica TaxID=69181 RepID=A0A8S9LAJ4_BRACR|nr:hypothetical protein F2Q68_00023918 [Brassica cretica]KAF2602388.1 hypothetical protein F2Q70_00024599 [Brassica cretica]KAF3577452.1 hypothetical protein DY000_02028691 [Brassica cretica]